MTIRLLTILICLLAMTLSATAQEKIEKKLPKPTPTPTHAPSLRTPPPSPRNEEERFWPPDYKPPQPTTQQTNADAIRAVLDTQVVAWNAGKLEEFMKGYWRSSKLTFFSGGRKLEGWDATLERYRKTYQAEGKEMGKLVFFELDIQPVGNAAVVRGRWELTLSDGKKPNGLFTLMFRRFNSGWKIVHDHTSSSE